MSMTAGDGVAATILAVIVLATVFSVGVSLADNVACKNIRLRIGTDAYDAAVKAEICK